WVDAAMLVFVAIDALANAHYAAQDVTVYRDPGVYAVTGAWLVHHHSLVIQTHPRVFGSPTALHWFGLGFGLVGSSGRVFAQGTHLLPSLLATAGWLAGPYRALQVPAVLGAAGLLAVYGFIRLLARPLLAAVGAILLAGTLPQIAFSRDSYTEPLDQLLTFGALILLWRAVEGRRARDALVGGLVLGAGAMSRADGFVSLLVLLPVVTVVLAGAAPGRRAAALRWSGALTVGAAGPGVLAARDLALLAPGYYSNLHSNLQLILEAGVGLAVLGAATVALAWSPACPRGIDRATRRWRGTAAAGGVLGLAALLASRPLWLVGHTTPTDVAIPLVRGLQRQEGLPLDPTRNYSEHTVAWLVWYGGLPAMVLGALGLALLAGRVLRGRDLPALPFALLLGGTALLYLVKPSIAPDQIWAARRFLPVILPGLLVCAALALDRLSQVRWARLPWAAPALAVVLVPVSIIPIAHTTKPLVRVRQLGAELAQLQGLCRALPPDAAVVFTDAFGYNAVQSVRSFCGVAAETWPAPSQATLAAVEAAAAAHGRVLYAVATDLAGLPVDPARPVPPLNAISITSWVSELTRAPYRSAQGSRELFLARVEPSGLLAGPGKNG
ncbi:MAG: glycosyltransferase family protein, partial [Mycobacteriales bacterium]